VAQPPDSMLVIHRGAARPHEVSPLYGTMETHEQDSVLKAREGWRKVPSSHVTLDPMDVPSGNL